MKASTDGQPCGRISRGANRRGAGGAQPFEASGTPAPPAPPSLSPSRVADFVTCPLRHRFRTIDRLPERSSAAVIRARWCTRRLARKGTVQQPKYRRAQRGTEASGGGRLRGGSEAPFDQGVDGGTALAVQEGAGVPVQRYVIKPSIADEPVIVPQRDDRLLGHERRLLLLVRIPLPYTSGPSPLPRIRRNGGPAEALRGSAAATCPACGAGLPGASPGQRGRRGPTTPHLRARRTAACRRRQPPWKSEALP